ncbi:OB-fold-containig protein [Aureliella helgolandensis]|uniref:DUF1449 domain-containing protein n=1 Tax=Aureliella helgolandensis TaxID=2527968 RepID=A0A518G925_9BACT|nr:OB-fold-containig protein [Aureliella helgolandensis]QDV25080.1 hypothetical protein Q31a_34020 [Aureliella helgolandensis]
MELFTNLIASPVLPATVLLGLMVAWSFMAMLGAVDLDVGGPDVDIGQDLDLSVGSHATEGMALLALKWLNIKNVPLVVWLGVFSVIWWFISISLWSAIDSRIFTDPGWFWSTLLILKNLAISLPLAKLATTPMKPWFVVEKIGATHLIGQECQISSLEATPEFGQVRFRTEGAPLLLNVRTDGQHLAKGTKVWITHYDAQHRVYIVSPTTTESLPP